MSVENFRHFLFVFCSLVYEIIFAMLSQSDLCYKLGKHSDQPLSSRKRIIKKARAKRQRIRKQAFGELVIAYIVVAAV
jgi:hypothetical protein